LSVILIIINVNKNTDALHEYSGEFNIVIFVSICTLSFYAINMNVVSLFTNSSFLFLANLYCIDVLYQFE